MSAPQKFMFENSFDKKAEIIDPLAELKSKFEARIEQARREAFEEGREKGKAEALETIENQTAEALASLNKEVTTLKEQFTFEMDRHEEQAVEFGITAGTKLAGELIRQTPMTLVESFFKEAFAVIRGVPEVTARVNPALHQSIIEASERWQAQAGHEGTIKYIEDPDIKPGDVAINWSDGGAERSLDKVMNAIHTAMTNHFKARKATQSPNAEAQNKPPVDLIEDNEVTDNVQPHI